MVRGHIQLVSLMPSWVGLVGPWATGNLVGIVVVDMAISIVGELAASVEVVT